MQSLTQASSGGAPAAASPEVIGLVPAGEAAAGAAGAVGCDFGAADDLGCTCWASAAGIVSAKASAPAPAHSVSRAAQRLSMFDRTLDQTIMTFPLLAGRFGS